MANELMEFFDFGSPSKKREAEAKQNRQENTIQLQKQLFDIGITDPAIINDTIRKYVDTGDLSLPSEKQVPAFTQPTRYKSGNTEISQFPDTVVTPTPDGGESRQDYVPLKLGKQTVAEPTYLTRIVDPQGNVVNSIPTGKDDKITKLSRPPAGKAISDNALMDEWSTLEIYKRLGYTPEQIALAPKKMPRGTARILLSKQGGSSDIGSMLSSWANGDESAAPSQPTAPPVQAETRSVGGHTYKKMSDGQWHRQD
jgi:hypothetical protein